MLPVCECAWGHLMWISLLDKLKSLFLSFYFLLSLRAGLEYRNLKCWVVLSSLLWFDMSHAITRRISNRINSACHQVKRQWHLEFSQFNRSDLTISNVWNWPKVYARMPHRIFYMWKYTIDIINFPLINTYSTYSWRHCTGNQFHPSMTQVKHRTQWKIETKIAKLTDNRRRSSTKC
jgi:hypothetical protein